MRLLTPMPDSTIDMIPGMQARKIIIYSLDDGSLFSIDYLYQVDTKGERKPAKCAVTRQFPNEDPVDLNPSRNIGSAKDIIRDIFDIDESFDLLSYISATQKGLGNLIPSQRKTFIKSALSSVDFYVGLFKMLTKKHSILKSMLNSISTKLSQIGNVEILTDMLAKQQIELNSLQERKNVLVESTATIKAEMNSITEGTDIVQRYQDAIKKQKELQEQYDSLPKIQDMEYSEEKLISLEKESSSKEAKLDLYRSRLQELVEEEQQLRREKEDKEIELKSLCNIEIMDDIKNKIQENENTISSYTESFNSIGFSGYEYITKDQYNDAINAIDYINTTISLISDKYSESDRKIAVSNTASSYTDTQTDTLRLIDVLDTKVQDIKKVLEEQDRLSIATKDYENIPKDCNHIDDCPFISTLVENKSKLLEPSKIKNLTNKRDELILDIEHARQTLEKQAVTSSCIREVRELFSYIKGFYYLISKFPNTEFLSDTNSLSTHVVECIPIDIDLTKFREYSNYIEYLNALKQDQEVLKDQLQKYEKSISVSESLKEKIDTLFHRLEDILEKKSVLLDTTNTLANETLSINNSITSMRYIKASKEKYDSITKEIEDTNKTVDTLDKSVKKYESLSLSYTEQKTELNTLSLTSIPTLTNEIEKSKYKLVMYEQYKKDLSEYQALYNKEEMIRKYSGTNGIQTVYMSVFMNSILQNTNNLLKLLFNGSFRLEPFEINETEFNIPCVDMEGNRRRDISLMSDSQLSMISMIISFVIFHEASRYYNIIKLDEVDDNLDNANRLQFSILLNQLMDVLHYDQALVISHNDEIDITNTDMILFKIENTGYLENLKHSGANIIYSYQ